MRVGNTIKIERSCGIQSVLETLLKKRPWCYWHILLCFTWALPAWATPELDFKYTLETVGFIRSWDKDGGLFSDTVNKALNQAAKDIARFRINNLSSANSIFTRSKLPYLKIIQDTRLLAQLAKTTHTESLIRTRVTKQGTHYFFTLDWLHFPEGVELGTIQFTIEIPDTVPFTVERILPTIEENLNQLFLQVPFVGQILGIEGKRIIVNVGKTQFLKPGDTLTIGTLQEAREHPILKKILDWRLQPTAELVVEQVEESLSFCKMIRIEPGQSLLRHQKVVQVRPKKN